MLLKALFSAPLPLLALAANIPRQATDSGAAPSATNSAAATGSVTAAPSSMSAPPDVPFTLVSSNPTAFPLSDIVATPVTHTTIPLEWTFTAGEANTAIASATVPPLPTGELFVCFYLFFSVMAIFGAWAEFKANACRSRRRLAESIQ